MRLPALALGVAAALGCSIPDFPSRPADGAVTPDGAVVTPDMDVVPGNDSGLPPGDTGLPPVDTGEAPEDVPGPVDVPPTDVPPGAIPAAIAAALPAFDGATTARVRALRAAGLARGNRAAVFAKIGDSITEAGSFLSDVGNGWFTLGGYEWLRGTIAYFSATSLGDFNSFDRPSACAMGGWVSAQALEGDPDSALRRELNATRPAYAIVMYGTNDVDRGGVDALQPNLERIAQIIEEFGTVPVLSTIPDRLDNTAAAAGVAPINAAIRALAASRHLPLIDYWQAMQPLPRHGVSDDGIHPSVFVNRGDPEAGTFTDAGLMYGYNMRNLTAILMLDRLRNLP